MSNQIDPEKKHHQLADDFFYNSVSQLKRRHYITSQAFWVFAFENCVKDKYIEFLKKTGKSEDPNIQSLSGYINCMENYEKHDWNNNNFSALKKLNNVRNEIVHGDLLENRSVFHEAIESLGEMISGCKKNREKLFDGINPEKDTEVSLRLKDRRQFSSEEVEKYSEIESNDFIDDDILERKIWRLKYILDRHLKGLATGLVSEFHNSSEWFWIPVGIGIKNSNERVGKAIISVLVMRNRNLRIYLDFGTRALMQRTKYYKLIENIDEKENKEIELIRRVFADLCEKEKMTEFWNVEHYSMITDSFCINDFYNNTKRTTAMRQDFKCYITRERTKIEEAMKTGKGIRKNILLIGKEQKGYFEENRSLDQCAIEIKNFVDILSPLLKIFE